MSNLIPPLGAKGIYELSNPFNVKLIPNTVYECVAIRKIVDLVELNVDPFDTFYNPENIPITKYNQDVVAGVTIVSLLSSSGDVVYVPSTYITKYPNSNGIRYTGLLLAINLGPIPDFLNLNPVRQKIAEVVRDYIGVTSSTQLVAVSESKLIDNQTSTAIEASRAVNINNSNTDYSRYLQEKQMREALQQRVAELEQHIASQL